jgi:hypothetical protein
MARPSLPKLHQVLRVRSASRESAQKVGIRRFRSSIQRGFNGN